MTNVAAMPVPFRTDRTVAISPSPSSDSASLAFLGTTIALVICTWFAVFAVAFTNR